MEKEYVDELLKDLSKTSSPEDKIHLLTVFVTELAKSDAEYKKDVAELKDSLMWSSEAIKSITKVIGTTTDRLDEIMKNMIIMSNQSLKTAGTVTRNAESILFAIEGIGSLNEIMVDIYKNITSINNNISKISENKCPPLKHK